MSVSKDTQQKSYSVKLSSIGVDIKQEKIGSKKSELSKCVLLTLLFI